MKLFGKRTREAVNDKGKKSIKKDSKGAMKFDATSLNRCNSPSTSPINKDCINTLANRDTENEKCNIEQIIHMDYSLLNAKQRRQLKRHQHREIVKKRETPEIISDKISLINVQQSPPKYKTSHGAANSGDRATGSDVTAVNASIIISVASLDQDLGKEEALADDSVRESSCFSSSSNYCNEIMQEILQSNPAEWNSKQRRLVKRYKERGGKVLGNTNKKKQNWSHLPDEERVRREKQRQMQKEAAERRAMNLRAAAEGSNGIDCNSNSKRHPLNSERRRANRRKPKRTRHFSAKRSEAEKLV
jgi:hypothetical protein